MSKALRSLRPTKHNMAKGALRPEDALVCHSVHPPIVLAYELILG